MKRSNKRRENLKIAEVVIVIAIAVLMIFLINFSNLKLDEVLNAEQEALLMAHDPDNPIHSDLAREIIKFRPNACKMIEVYSKDLVPLFKVQFVQDEHNNDDNITSYPGLTELLTSNQEGHTSIQLDGKDEDVYFRWAEDSTGDNYLVIIYMSRPVVKNFWVFSFISYMVLILVFILLMMLIFSKNQSNIRLYESLSREARSRMMGE